MIKFCKMHGAGNDFIIVESDVVKGIDYSKLALEICDRHFGIGGDGLMVVEESLVSDIKMVYYNSDGSVAKMCGNGIRCFSKYVYSKKIIRKTNFTVETLDGEKRISIKVSNDKESTILVDMGKPLLSADAVPVITNKKEFLQETVSIDNNMDLKVSSILMGVPHTVILVEDIEKHDILKTGPLLENHELFPDKTNVNFVQVIDKENILVDTWERGAGKTLACGTGVCASVVICYLLNKVTQKVRVKVPGGILNIYLDDNLNILMEGNAHINCEGKYYLDNSLIK